MFLGNLTWATTRTSLKIGPDEVNLTQGRWKKHLKKLEGGEVVWKVI